VGTSPATAAVERATALVRAHLRLVTLIARQFANRGVETLDLIQEGCIGLIKASRRFDESRGVRFSTYATWWIRQSMGRALAEQSRTVRLPHHVRSAMREIAQTAHDLVVTLGRPAAPAEIALRLASTTERIERMLDLRALPISLDGPGLRSINNLLPLIERLPAEGASHAPDLVLEARARTGAVRQAIDRLPPLERDMVALRFGIDCDPCSLERAAARLGFNTHQAHQIYQRALKKLRYNPQLIGLLDP
jgi:RNA polymerase primary sigma factor